MSRNISLLKTPVPPILIALFFSLVAVANLSVPSSFVFDEVHYVPAAYKLNSFEANSNWDHPPLGKLAYAFAGVPLGRALHRAVPGIPEITGLRLIALLASLWLLLGISAWMQELGFTARAVSAATWLTGFNFLWFTHARIVMLEPFVAAFGVWGCLYIFRSFRRSVGPAARAAFLWGWTLVGLAFASKWSGAMFMGIAGLLPHIAFGRARISREAILPTLAGLAAAAAAYFLTFIPLAFVAENAVSPSAFLHQQAVMYGGLKSLADATHPYASKWWMWPTLIRPMWYHYESVGEAFHRCVFASGNPPLFILGTLAALYSFLAWRRSKLDSAAQHLLPGRVLSVLFWIPMLFWILTPRSTQYFYYFHVPALWLGPLCVWIVETQLTKMTFARRRWLLVGFVVLCGAAFVYFLPILDGRLIPTQRYQDYMWFNGWI